MIYVQAAIFGFLLGYCTGKIIIWSMQAHIKDEDKPWK